MPMNERSFLPPSTRATGRKPNPNRGYKCPNPHSEYQTAKPLPQVDFRRGYKGTESRTVGKPLFQQRIKLNPIVMPKQIAPYRFTLLRGRQAQRFSTQQTGAGRT
jgi:hypothetical protein